MVLSKYTSQPTSPPAREIQKQRFEGCTGLFANAQMRSRMVREYCRIDEAGQLILKQAMDRLGLSARAYDRILKVARTIADLDGSPNIEVGQIACRAKYNYELCIMNY